MSPVVIYNAAQQVTNAHPVNIGRIFLEYLWWLIRILSGYRKPKICVYDPSKMSRYYAHTCKPFTKTRNIYAYYTLR
jgi:hypothetical protein